MITVLESRSREARCWQPWFLSGFLWENPVHSRLAVASLQPQFPSSHGFLLFVLSSCCKDASLWVGPPQKISRFLIVSAHILFPKRVAFTGAGGYDMDIFFFCRLGGTLFNSLHVGIRTGLIPSSSSAKLDTRK